MRRLFTLAAASGASLLTLVAPASAATILNFSGGVGTLMAGESLANDAGFYTSGTTPYIFLEKTILDGLTTSQIFLFHFDSPGNNGGNVDGSFQIQLSPGTNSVSLLSDQLSALDAQDALYGVSGVTYPTGLAGRGLEGNDSFVLDSLIGNLQTVKYDISGNGNNLDQIRFVVTNQAPTGGGADIPPVPEPATWATMILGFGAIGAAMRRRNKVRLRVA